MAKYIAEKDNGRFYIQANQVNDFSNLGYTIYKEEPVAMTEDEIEEVVSGEETDN